VSGMKPTNPAHSHPAECSGALPLRDRPASPAAGLPHLAPRVAERPRRRFAGVQRGKARYRVAVRLERGGDGPEMAAAAAGLGQARLPGGRPSCLAHGVSQRFEIIVAADPGLLGVGLVTHDLPAARRGEALRVGLAQVVGVRLGVGRERTDDRAGQDSRGRTLAPRTPPHHRAAPCRARVTCRQHLQHRPGQACEAAARGPTPKARATRPRPAGTPRPSHGCPGRGWRRDPPPAVPVALGAVRRPCPGRHQRA
jgi:hypothetical protein